MSHGNGFFSQLNMRYLFLLCPMMSSINDYMCEICGFSWFFTVWRDISTWADSEMLAENGAKS